MAVNTEERRRAAQDSSHPGVLPVADGTQDITDRGHMQWLYVTSNPGTTAPAEPAPRRRTRRGWPPVNPFTQMALEQRIRPPQIDIPPHGSRRHDVPREDDDV